MAVRRRGPFADPGYQADGRKRYQLDTIKHIETAWRFIHWPSHSRKYTSYQLAQVRKRIRAAARARGITLR